jgi:hypothetical protein
MQPIVSKIAKNSFVSKLFSSKTGKTNRTSNNVGKKNKNWSQTDCSQFQRIRDPATQDLDEVYTLSRMPNDNRSGLKGHASNMDATN